MENEKYSHNLKDYIFDNQKIWLEGTIVTFKKFISDQAIILNNNYNQLNEESKIPVAASFFNEGDDIPEFIGDRYLIEAKRILTLFNNSTYLGLYSFVESRLKDYCRHIEAITKIEYLRNNKNASGYIEKDISYLASVFGGNFLRFKKYKENLSTYSAIRNAIAHNDSSIWNERKKSIKEQSFYCQINSLKGVLITDIGEIEISTPFLIDFCDYLKDFLVEVSNEILLMRRADKYSVLHKKNQKK